MTTSFPVRGGIFRIVVLVIVRIMVPAVFALAMCGLISCSPPAATSGASSESPSAAGSVAPRTETHQTTSPVRDLRQDEKAGGHILRKHVGQTEQQLRNRLERDRSIIGASTYTDLPAAEHAVGAAIAQSQGQIQSWLAQTGVHPNLVLDYDTDVPIGRTMIRGEIHSHVREHAVVILKYTRPDHYYV
jgi:hypothetical protein